MERLSDEHLECMKRQTWRPLYERRMIDELLELRAKLAAGPVMPEVPQSELVFDELSRVMSWERAIEMYADVRAALLKEQPR